jgi:hypothetical protein
MDGSLIYMELTMRAVLISKEKKATQILKVITLELVLLISRLMIYLPLYPLIQQLCFKPKLTYRPQRRERPRRRNSTKLQPLIS